MNGLINLIDLWRGYTFFLLFFLQTENHLRNLKLSGHVGFDSLPDQLVNKSVQNGFVFNILCISETGLGKSTLMDSLFNTNFESTPSPHTLPNVKLKAQTYELQESNVKLKVIHLLILYPELKMHISLRRTQFLNRL